MFASEDGGMRKKRGGVGGGGDDQTSFPQFCKIVRKAARIELARSVG